MSANHLAVVRWLADVYQTIFDNGHMQWPAHEAGYHHQPQQVRIGTVRAEDYVNYIRYSQ